MQDDRRPCPFCAELIKVESIKCRFCGEFLGGATPKGDATEPVAQQAHVESVVPVGRETSSKPETRADYLARINATKLGQPQAHRANAKPAEKQALKQSQAAYRAARLQYERAIKGAHQVLGRAHRGDNVTSGGGIVLTTWMITVAGKTFDAAGATATVATTKDEKKPVLLTVRDKSGRQYSVTRKQSDLADSERVARAVIDQGKWAEGNSSIREQRVDAARAEFNAAVANIDLVIPQAVSYADAAGLSKPTPTGIPSYSAQELLAAPVNDVLRNVTRWLPGGSPTVRRHHYKVAGIAAGAVVAVGGVLVIGALSNDEKVTRDDAVAAVVDHVDESAAVADEPATAVADYRIVRRADTRFDGAPTLYVLVDPVNVSSAEFQDQIREIIRSIVANEGGHVSIEIYDDSDMLDLQYRQYGDLSLGRMRTSAEDELLARHLVAAFSGELSTDLYPNTLYWFPAAFTDTAQVGRWVDVLEFDP